MSDILRNELFRQAREAKTIAQAATVTASDIQAEAASAFGRDDMMPIREIVAGMLGLKVRCEYTYHGWASNYGRYVRDEAARDLLNLLVKRTNLLANELKIGATALSPTAVVRVDKVLAFAEGRGWDVSSLMPADHAIGPAGTVRSVTRDEVRRAGILAMLKKLGYEPRALPKSEAGRSGVRLEVRKALGIKGIWAGSTVFDKTWQGMRDDGELADGP